MKAWYRIRIDFQDGTEVGFSVQEFERMLAAAEIMEDLNKLKNIAKIMKD